MSRRRAERDLPDPEDVLSGRVRASPAVFFALVHAANPSGLALPARERDRRYALKARLQSALIREHGYLLQVALDPRDPRVVSLAHADLDADAGHARRDALDEDARAWVQRRLDEDAAGALTTEAGARGEARGDRTPRGREGGRAGSGPAGALAAGRLALAEYDYDAARAHFEAALAEGPSTIEEAARELIALLVDVLALDEDALALAERLGGAPRTWPESRSRLAVACARLGDPEGALRWLRGVEGPPLADGLLALAERALADGALADARAHLDRIAREGLSHERLPAVREAWARRTAERRAEDERALDRALDDEAREQLARELLTRWPDSARAQKLVAEREAARRADAARERQRQAEAAREAGDSARALQLLLEARGLGAEVAEAQLDALTIAIERAEDDRAVSEVLGAGFDTDAAAHRYLEASARVRRRIRAQAPAARWVVLDELREALGDHPGRRATAWVAAVRTHEAAALALGAGEVLRAEELLATHMEVLSRSSTSRALVAEVSAGAHARRSAIERARIDEAERALATDDLAAARQALEPFDERRVTADDAARARRLRAELARRTELDELMRAVSTAEAAGELIEATRLAATVAQRSDGEQAAAWRVRHAALAAQARAAWRVRDLDTRGWGLRLADLGFEGWVSAPHAVWLTGDGQTLVVPSVHGRQLFLAELARDAAEVRRVIALELPAETHAEGITVVDDVVLIAEPSGLTELRLADAFLLRRDVFRAPADAPVDRLEVVPRTPYVWLECGAAGRANWHVWSRERRRMEREVGEGYHVDVVRGVSPRVVVANDELLVHDASGRRRLSTWPVSHDHPGIAERFVSVCLHPDGERLVALGARDEGEPAAEWVVQGSHVTTPIADFWPDSPYALASARALGTVFLVFSVGRAHRLIAFGAPRGDRLEERWRVEVPSLPVLVGDADGRHMTVLFGSGDAVSLGVDPPVGPWPESVWHMGPPSSWSCDARPGRAEAARSRAEALDASLRQIGREAGATGSDRLQDAAEELRRRVRRADPAQTSERLQRADAAAAAEDWRAVVEALRPAPTDAPPHHLHRLAEAHLWLGEAELAAQVLAAVPDDTYTCALPQWREVARALAGHGGPLAPLVLGVQAADDALARGDARAALAALHTPALLVMSEVQSSARRVAAALALTSPGAPADRVRAEVACAHLLALDSERLATELPLPSARRWPPEKVAELRAAARAWLDGAAQRWAASG